MALLGYTQSKVSEVGKVNSADLNQWSKNLLAVLLGAATIYLLQINTTDLSWNGLIPTQQTLGAIKASLVSGLYLLAKKYANL